MPKGKKIVYLRNLEIFRYLGSRTGARSTSRQTTANPFAGTTWAKFAIIQTAHIAQAVANPPAKRPIKNWMEENTFIGLFTDWQPENSQGDFWKGVRYPAPAQGAPTEHWWAPSWKKLTTPMQQNPFYQGPKLKEELRAQWNAQKLQGDPFFDEGGEP